MRTLLILLALSLAANQAQAAVALVVATTAKSTVADASIAVTSSIDTTGANLLVVAVGYSGASLADLSDSKSNTWTALTNVDQGVPSVRLFYCLSPTVGSGHTFTWDSSANVYPAIAVTAWSGVSAYEEQNTNTTASGTTIQPNSVTPDGNGSLVITAVCHGSTTSTYSIDSGFTIEGEVAFLAANNMAVCNAYLIQGTAGAINPTFTGSANTPRAAAIAVFSPAAGSSLGGAFYYRQQQ